MRLCIADPPYLGYASMWYGSEDVSGVDLAGNVAVDGRRRPQAGSSAKSTIAPPRKADVHPDAHLWDEPQRHAEMVARLERDYDGWAIAMNPPNLADYLRWVTVDVRVAVWVKPNAMPTNSRPIRSWEPVLIHVPKGRRRANGRPPFRDYLIANTGAGGFAGAKPHTWTRWVLDMLGYDPETDTVDDLFHGSGAVAAEIAQGVLSLGRPRSLDDATNGEWGALAAHNAAALARRRCGVTTETPTTATEM